MSYSSIQGSASPQLLDLVLSSLSLSYLHDDDDDDDDEDLEGEEEGDYLKKLIRYI